MGRNDSEKLLQTGTRRKRLEPSGSRAFRSRVGLITKIGKDAFGEMAKRFYREQGMSLARIYEDPEETSAAATIVIGPGVTEHVPAFKVDKVVETTGAGDAFAGGFAVALAEKKLLVEAVRFGWAVAGISVTRRGTAPSMPYRKEVDELMSR